MCTPACLSVRPSTCSDIMPTVSLQYTWYSSNMGVYVSVCLSVCLSQCPYIRRCTCSYVCSNTSSPALPVDSECRGSGSCGRLHRGDKGECPSPGCHDAGVCVCPFREPRNGRHRFKGEMKVFIHGF